MQKRILIYILLIMSCFSRVNAEIRITEIMTNNVSTIISDKYNYDGFVEFYNDGANVDLKDWTVSNTKEGQLNWSLQLKESHVLPYGYSLLFFGSEETSSANASRIQYNYAGSVGKKLTTDEGKISFSKDGKTIELSYPKQYPHISYCKEGFMMPTPGKENDRLVTTITNRVASPKFKTGKPGLYENSLTVELDCETDNVQIYYTLNGDIPTVEKGIKYNGSISIEKTTVVRARAYKDGMLYSEMLTGSFILPDKYYNACKGVGERLPIVSISADSVDLFSDMLGIYVDGTNGSVSTCYTTPYNFNQDWTRSANFEYMLDGNVVDNQEVEIGVYGGCTRINVGKSLKIKANKRSGTNKMLYDKFLPGRDYTKYKSLALRNGGNGYSYVQPRWRDMFIQSLGDGLNLDRQMAQPVSFYLNGAFYGLMILTERSNMDFVYHNYGLDEDKIDFISLDGDYVCLAGTKEAYDQMINYVSKNYSSNEFYDKLDEMIDIDEYMNYQILEQYVANTDWIKNNTKLWRKHDGGKFRWIVFDTDFGLSKATSVDKDMLVFATTESGYDSWILLKSCMMNEDFRWRFLDQYLDRLENQFTDEAIDTKLDSIWDMTKLDMCATIKNAAFLRAPGNPTVYDQEVEDMRRFAKERKSYVVDQLKKEFGLGNDRVTVKINSVFPNSETPDFKFLLNKREFSSMNYQTWRYSNERINVKPIVPNGYKIEKWAINDNIVRSDNGERYFGEDLTTIANSGELKITIYFEYSDDAEKPTAIFLNEVCASNSTTPDENGKMSDWIEIYNGSDKDVDLAGMVVENTTKKIQCTIPTGSKETVLPSHGYKLLWADKLPENGPLHLNFKLSFASSETVTLSMPYRDEDIIHSTITYEPHETDESYGRATDGSDKIVRFAKCVDSNGNKSLTSTPLAPNGSVFCENSEVDQVSTAKSDFHVYVYGNTIVVQNVTSGKQVEVLSPLSVTIAKKRATSDVVEITAPFSGTYVVRVGSESRKVVVK